MDFFPNLRLSPSSPFTDYKMKIQKYVFPYLPHSVTESYCLVSPNWFFTDFFSNKVVLLLMFIKTGFNWEQVMLRLQKISLSISWEITNLLLRFRAVPGGIYVVFCQMQQVFHQIIPTSHIFKVKKSWIPAMTDNKKWNVKHIEDQY